MTQKTSSWIAQRLEEAFNAGFQAGFDTADQGGYVPDERTDETPIVEFQEWLEKSDIEVLR